MSKVAEIQGEMVQTFADYNKAKEEGRDDDSSRLLALYYQQEKSMLTLQDELEQDSISDLFGKESNEVFENIVKNIFSKNPKFFN
jgi:hypothetical protein